MRLHARPYSAAIRANASNVARSASGVLKSRPFVRAATFYAAYERGDGLRLRSGPSNSHPGSTWRACDVLTIAGAGIATRPETYVAIVA
jgi:hypothetical protein